MAVTRITGFDGNITMPTTIHNGAIRTWSAQFPSVASETTAFGDSVRRRRLGILDVTGSAVGVPMFDSTTTEPGVGDKVRGGSALTLTVATGCTYAFVAVFENISFSVDKTGDSVLTFDFAAGDSTSGITETWDETA